MRITELHEPKEPDLIAALRDFLPLAMGELKISKLPEIKLRPQLENMQQPTFGRFVNNECAIYLAINDRHPVDILRTLAHELVHFKQFISNELDHTSGETGSPEENEAHETAGVIMRHFDKKFPDYFSDDPVMLETSFKQRIKTLKRKLNPFEKDKIFNRGTEVFSKGMRAVSPTNPNAYSDEKAAKTASRLMRHGKRLMALGFKGEHNEDPHYEPFMQDGEKRSAIISGRKVQITREGDYYRYEWKPKLGIGGFEEKNVYLCPDMKELMNIIKAEIEDRDAHPIMPYREPRR